MKEGLILTDQPIQTFEIPTWKCEIHGEHAAWIQFHYDANDEKQPHYCLKCIQAHLDTSGIGKAYDTP